MKHLGLILALLAMSTNVMAAARTSAMASSASRSRLTSGSMTLSRHDGRMVTHAEQFVKRGRWSLGSAGRTSGRMLLSG